MMNVLVIGSGGREHALAWKLAASPRVERVFIAPGNGGTSLVGENVPIPATDIPALARFAREQKIGLTVVGPDDCLAAGLADFFLDDGLPVFGVSRAAAQLEASKSFAKDFMRRHNIPTANARVFEDCANALAWSQAASYPLVVKADGLALGKGVVIAQTPEEAGTAIRRCMEERAFGEAGARILLEEHLTGRECSIHAIVDGSGYLAFPDARDHKRAQEGDQGPNTGGMGTNSPSGFVDEALWERIRAEILDRFVTGLRAEGLVFRGLLFPGLMLTTDGPKVLEFNCRFGDPETQSLMRRLDSDLLELLEAATQDRVATQTPKWSADAACCVILASKGYPGPCQTGFAISGLERASASPTAQIFHAGTKTAHGETVTAGGRVLGVTATGASLEEARARAYAAAGQIRFDGKQFRSDIGAS